MRAALAKTLQRPFARADVEQVPMGDSDRATRARRKAADRLLEGRRSHRRDFDAILRSHAEAEGFELPSAPSRSMPSPFHRAVLETGARMMLGGSADVTGPRGSPGGPPSP